MSLYTLTTNQTLPYVPSPAGLTIEECTNLELLAFMANTSVQDVIKRIANDHIAFVAYIHNVPAAFGWMARGKAFVGELNHEIILPLRNRYLWNFRTMEAFRGRGIYPALLQFIIRFEQGKADTFWIIHAPENKASLKGIQKAGFNLVGQLYTSQGITTIEATKQSHAKRRQLDEMNITVSAENPASCWNCSSPYLKKREAQCCCLPVKNDCIGNNLVALAS
ncbi:MAG: N-acetyltransferase [Flavisolibacter sp.]|nr:N-acetyltransferase [Flavisolibacter sp.]